MVQTFAIGTLLEWTDKRSLQQACIFLWSCSCAATAQVATGQSALNTVPVLLTQNLCTTPTNSDMCSSNRGSFAAGVALSERFAITPMLSNHVHSAVILRITGNSAVLGRPDTGTLICWLLILMSFVQSLFRPMASVVTTLVGM